MYYLGIAGGYPLKGTGHDPAACLIKGNKIIAIAEEERFIRYKHAEGVFPANAIKFCLSKAGIELKDVEKIGFYWSPRAYWRTGKSLKRILWNFYATSLFKVIPKFFKYHFGLAPEIEFIEHHITHTFSSCPFSGFKKSLSLSIDGAGERTSTLITSYKNGEIEVLKEKIVPDSLGQLYGQFTKWLGFKINDGEGKTMGLAPYGNPRYELSSFVKYGNGDYSMGCDLWDLYEKIEKTFGPRRRGEIKQLHKDVAASVQKTLEDIVFHLVEYYQEVTGYKNLCLAGGVALNCKMNGMLLESGLIKDIFIQPLANDAGCAIGAAAYLAMQDGYKFRKLEHVYYGPEYSEKEIESVLKEAKVKYEKISDPAGEAAELIAKGKIVGWFQGRMECGPRALGNRSILADPSKAEMVDKINYFVKHREPWRPFCPSMLDKAKRRYMKKPYDSPFMILAFNTKEKAHEEIPAVLHKADKTMRPQTVTRKANPLYYKLIKEFERITGIPVVLNTSFNVAGEPIVCSPKDALGTFFKCGMDCLIMGSYILKK